MSLQLFAPYRCRRAGRIHPDRVKPLGNYHDRPGGKPSGGVWTSSYTPDAPAESDWVRFCHEEHPDWIPAYGYLYLPDSAVRVFTIRSVADLCRLNARYGPRADDEELAVDWKAVGAEWDGVHLTVAGLTRTRRGRPRLDCWDAECTVWCRVDVLRYVGRIRLRRAVVPRHRPEV